jgi:hypothetical protein
VQYHLHDPQGKQGLLANAPKTLRILILVPYAILKVLA